jgi:hypothetical protein
MEFHIGAIEIWNDLKDNLSKLKVYYTHTKQLHYWVFFNKKKRTLLSLKIIQHLVRISLGFEMPHDSNNAYKGAYWSPIKEVITHNGKLNPRSCSWVNSLLIESIFIDNVIISINSKRSESKTCYHTLKKITG